jgi:hypothetical protein
VIVAVRAKGFGLEATLYSTVPLEEPLAPLVIVTQAALTVVVHGHPAGSVNTLKLPGYDVGGAPEAPPGKDALGGTTLNGSQTPAAGKNLNDRSRVAQAANFQEETRG